MKILNSDLYTTGFINIKNSGAIGDGVTNCSSFFSEDAPGYIVNDGVYCVSASVMARLNKNNCIGNGWLRLYGPNYSATVNSSCYSPLDYKIKVSDLGNPLMKYLVTGSESKYFMDRPYCTRGLKPLAGACTSHVIGAIYKVNDVELPETFTICLGKLSLFILQSDGVWKKAAQDNYPAGYGLFELPWTPQTTKTLDNSKVTVCKDHIEYKLTPSDFDGESDGKVQACLHFWGTNASISDSADIIAVVCFFDFWVKEEEAADKFVATIGVDQVDTNTNTIKQGFSGIAFNCKPYVRTQIGTTMNRDEIEKYCNFEDLSQLHNVHIATNIFAKYNKQWSSTLFPSILSKVNNGDLYVHLFEEGNIFRNHMLINPIKHIYLPYHGSDDTVTGNYCKILSMPVLSSSVERITMRIQYFCYTNSDAAYKFVDLILSIYFNGTVKIKCINSNQANEGDITVVVSSDTITIYAYSDTWWHTIVDIEYLTYSAYDNLGRIVFDEELLRVGAGSMNINMDKWVSIDTTDCTIYKSPKTCILEDKINTLETRLATLEEQLSSSSAT